MRGRATGYLNQYGRGGAIRQGERNASVPRSSDRDDFRQVEKMTIGN